MLRTKSFELAINIMGDVGSDKLAIVLPGKLDTKDYECFNSHINYLARRGFCAISIDPPGTWDSPGGLGLFTTTNYIKAVNEIIDYFGDKQTLLIGHSRGGAVANIVGTNNSKVSGIVTIMASLGAPSMPNSEEIIGDIYIDYRDLPPGSKETPQQKKFEVPLSYFTDGKRYDDAVILKTCKKPKLMFYGTTDEFNTPIEVNEVFDSVPEPKELFELKCNHDYRYYPDIIEEINGVLGSFLEKYHLV